MKKFILKIKKTELPIYHDKNGEAFSIFNPNPVINFVANIVYKGVSNEGYGETEQEAMINVIKCLYDNEARKRQYINKHDRFSHQTSNSKD